MRIRAPPSRRCSRSATSPACARRNPGLHHLDAYFDAFAELDRSDIVAVALTLGVLLFAVVTAIMLVRTRLRAASADAAFRDEIMALKAERDRVNALLLSEPQILVSWAAADNEPDILGDTTLVTSASLPQRVLAFGSWLEPDKAQAMEHAVDALRADGEGFSMQLMTLAGRAIEADGRAIGGRAVLRLRDVSGLKRELAELNARHEKLVERHGIAAHADRGAALAGLGARHRRRADLRQSGLRARGRGQGRGRRGGAVGRAARPASPATRRAARAPPARITSRACRRSSPAPGAFSTCSTCRRARAAPASASTSPRSRRCASELNRLNDAHRRTLDQLATGVAIFAADQRLTFYNAAYRALWDLDAASSTRTRPIPPCSTSCARARKLPEEKDFREWKTALHEAYRATEAAASMSGICRMAAPCASSPRPIRKAA